MTHKQREQLKKGDIIMYKHGNRNFHEINLVLEMNNDKARLFCLFGEKDAYSETGDYDICLIALASWEIILNGK